jgi:hypothetical protein
MKRIVFCFLLLLMPSWASAAQTLAGAQAQIDSQIDTAGPIITATINACLATTEGCDTGWSCRTSDYCNNTDAGTLCQTNQTDPGIPAATLTSDTTCAVISTGHTFASIGATLPPTAAACYKSNTYSKGPGHRGVQLCYRFKYAGTYYEKCRGYGEQAASFNEDWQIVTP